MSNNSDALDTSQCNITDVYEYEFEYQPNDFFKFMVWEGGIAFAVAFWSSVLILFFLSLYLLRKCKFCPQYLSQRFTGDPQTPEIQMIDVKISWIGWFSLKFDEEHVGPDGTIYLRYQSKLIECQILMLILGIVLTIVHFFADKLGETPIKTLRSLGLNNIGANGIHSLFSCFTLGCLVSLMKKHGGQHKIKSLVSSSTEPTDSFYNKKCLMISRIPNLTPFPSESFNDYLRSTLKFKGISSIVLTYDTTVSSSTAQWKCIEVLTSPFRKKDLLKDLEEFKFFENVLKELNGNESTEDIHTQLWFNPFRWIKNEPKIDARDYFEGKQQEIKTRQENWLKNKKFAGSVFVLFNTPEEAKAAECSLKNYDGKSGDQDSDFKPVNWIVRYAPPSADIIWGNMPHQSLSSIPIKLIVLFFRWFKTFIMSAITYFIFINVMTAPGVLARYLHIQNVGHDEFSMLCKQFVLPTVVSFFTSNVTDWLTETIENWKGHLTTRKRELNIFRSTAILEIVLYIYRMLAMKPLPMIIFDSMTEDKPIQLPCLFFPVHGSFIACAIIVNTVSNILLTHSRVEFLWKAFVQKIFYSKSVTEYAVWRKMYKSKFDFSSGYAEIVSDFALAILFLPVFPVICLASCIFSILRFYSDRSALSNIHTVSEASYSVHQSAINMPVVVAWGSPLILFLYRYIQLSNHMSFLDQALLPPLCLFIGYGLYLIYDCWDEIMNMLKNILKWLDRCIRPASPEVDIDIEDEEEVERLTDSFKFREGYDVLQKLNIGAPAATI